MATSDAQSLDYSDAHKQALLSALRTVLAFAAGFIVSRGWITAEQATELTGATMALVPAAWGVFRAYNSERSAQLREHAAVQAGAAAAQAGVITRPESVTVAKAQIIIAAAKEAS